MAARMTKLSFKIFFIAAISGILSCQAFSQEKELISPYIQLQYFKTSDNKSYLQTTLTYSRNRMEIPVRGAEIIFMAGEKAEDKLASSVTDENGIARLSLDGNTKVPENSDGTWSLSSEFRGNDTIEKAVSDISVKPMNLEMNLTMADSIRTIRLEGTTFRKGVKEPVAGETVILYVPRMFSLLPVGEATLDENGRADVEFPSDIPGDKNGMITVIARIEDNPVYGNIEKRETIGWGIPTTYSQPVTHRALWTKTPPTWMIVTLSILLAGVWGHYMFAVISLILIKLDARKKKKKKENLQN
jgi:hypothetical protein